MPITASHWLIWIDVLASWSIQSKYAVALARHTRYQGAGKSISLVQWNVHGECFNACKHSTDVHCDHSYPACKKNAAAFLVELLAGKNEHAPDVPDFVGLEEWGDAELLHSSTDGDTWASLTHSCGGTNGYGAWPFDSATIVYNKKKWEVRKSDGRPQDPIGGCMERVKDKAVNLQVNSNTHRYKRNSVTSISTERDTSTSGENNYRSFFLQAFKHKSDDTEFIAVVSHFPHTLKYSKEIGPLREAIDKMQKQTGLTKVIFMIDSNWHFPDSDYPRTKTSAGIIDDLNADAGDIVSSEPHLTCCAWEYFANYDRIIATGFPGAADPLKTSLPFGDALPSWMAFNMHKPIAGRLTFPDNITSANHDARTAVKLNYARSSASLNVALAICSMAVLVF